MDTGEARMDWIGEVMASYTQTQLDALRAAVATGALQVRNSNHEMVTYRSLEEMQRLIGVMERALGGARSAVLQPTYSKGFDS